MDEDKCLASGGLAFFVIRAKDMEKSAAFYRSLAISFERHSHPPSGEHFASIGSATRFSSSLALLIPLNFLKSSW